MYLKCGSLLGLLAQGLYVSAAVLPAQEKVKRDNETITNTILSALLASFSSHVPSASENGIKLLGQLLSSLNGTYTLPKTSQDPSIREASLNLVRENFLYGAPVAGGPAYPSGELGVAKNVEDIADIMVDLTPELALTSTDGVKAEKDIAKYNGLKTMDDYLQIYNGEWSGVMPRGPDAGAMTNYTQDLFFSMQRLSNSPYSVRRLRKAENLPFTIDDSTSKAISGMSLNQLHDEGRLFYSDHRGQAKLKSTGRFAAACDAYFYISAASGDFLPLAIRTNTGANLIYTPEDSPNDWLLAKIMYNVNDFWFAQWNHLAATHEVVQIVWMAAIRSLSREHPVYAILDRLTYELFSIQVLAETILFAPGGAVDQLFAYTGQSAQNFTTDQYLHKGAGRFRANYFKTNLRSRGLLGVSCNGPSLKHFPFYEDAKVISDATRAFLTSFVQSYYSSDSEVAGDAEIQAWAAQCNGDAKCIDFPAEITSTKTLVDILVHIAHLGSSAHHSVNTNQLLEISSTLPFSTPSLYTAPPTAKSADTNPAHFLPTFDKVVTQLIMASLFARPLLAGSNRTIIHMFNEPKMLSQMNPQTQEANAVFMKAMRDFSAQVEARTFDADGLSQGMPFVWNALDPNVAPYSLTV